MWYTLRRRESSASSARSDVAAAAAAAALKAAARAVDTAIQGRESDVCGGSLHQQGGGGKWRLGDCVAVSHAPLQLQQQQLQSRQHRSGSWHRLWHCSEATP
eukprot:331392-Chlamydomonas_euryale.AAC.5